MLRQHADSRQLVMWSTDYPRPTRRDSLPRLVYLLSAIGGICMKHLLSIRVCISVRFQSGRSQWGINKYTLRFLSISITHTVPPPPPFLPWPWKLYDRVTLKFYLIYQVFPLITFKPRNPHNKLRPPVHEPTYLNKDGFGQFLCIKVPFNSSPTMNP